MFPEVLTLFSMVAKGAEQAVRRTLSAQRNLPGLCSAVASCHAIQDKVFDEFAGMLSEGGPLQCAKGCDYCCRTVVRVRPLEGVYAVAQAAAAFPPEEARALRQRAFSAPAPCAFLVDGVCSVYAARPRVCRDHYSFSLDACKAGRFCERPEGERQGWVRSFGALRHRQDLRHLVSAAALNGMTKGCERLGLDNGETYLHLIVRTMLSDPGAVDRWLFGRYSFPAIEP
jgi:hypothetical protein